MVTRRKPPQRSRCIKTRVTPAQAGFIKENARRHGLSVSEWCQRVALDRSMPHPQPALNIEAKHLLRDLDRMLEEGGNPDDAGITELRARIARILLLFQTAKNVMTLIPPADQSNVRERGAIKLYLHPADADSLVSLARKRGLAIAAYLRGVTLTTHSFEYRPALSGETLIALENLRGSLRHQVHPHQSLHTDLNRILGRALAELEVP